jgi:hypothetical protein
MQTMSRRPFPLTEIGGVEETKEENDAPLSTLTSISHRQSSFLIQPNASIDNPIPRPAPKKDETLAERIQSLAKSVLCSCGHALSFFTDGCRWTADHQQQQQQQPAGRRPPESLHGAPGRPNLSITNELRQLAAKEGRVFGGGMRSADIPQHLGEDAVYSFDDDNISAISQNTLEELSRHGIRYPIRRKASSSSGDGTPCHQALPSLSASSVSDDPKNDQVR